MATVRNKTANTLDLRCIGRAVEPGEKVEVPDDVFNALTWASSIWDTSTDSDAEPRRATKRTAKDEE